MPPALALGRIHFVLFGRVQQSQEVFPWVVGPLGGAQGGHCRGRKKYHGEGRGGEGRGGRLSWTFLLPFSSMTSMQVLTRY